MKHIELLDCTLRDGAYLIDKKFGEQNIHGIIHGLIEAKIDYIEIGFLQDTGFGKGKTVYRNTVDAGIYVPKSRGNSEFTVLADYSRYHVCNLNERKPNGVDAVRACFFKEERYAAIEFCRQIKEKGYKLFVQPVDILGYSDIELIKYIEELNRIEPYCFSIVDTFGSMYQEDLHRVFEIVNHNLSSRCKIGFHSHNNLQLSNALSQELVRMSVGKREVVVDGTISGMGRGAGNTPTELIMQYLVSQQGYSYEVDSILDLIDSYMDNIRAKCTWGYSTDYFISGSYGAHVNNISYLTKKHSIRSNDIRFVLNKIGNKARKKYDYKLLDRTYFEMMNSDIDDQETLKVIAMMLRGRQILILAPGNSLRKNSEMIRKYITVNHPIVISVNFIPDFVRQDILFISNQKRITPAVLNDPNTKIVTSNLSEGFKAANLLMVSFNKLVKCGWELMDNSTLMLLRLLDCVGCEQIIIAGFDGYSIIENERHNYFNDDLEIESPSINPMATNKEIDEMLRDFNVTKKTPGLKIKFLTKSRFEECVR